MSNDSIISALGASNKAVVQKANATKASSDQFAKIFADNAAAHNQADLARVDNRSAPVPPRQTGYRNGVDDYRHSPAPASQPAQENTFSNTPSQPNNDAQENSDIQTKNVDNTIAPRTSKVPSNSSKSSDKKPESTVKKSSPITENPDLNDQQTVIIQTDPAQLVDTSSILPVLVQSAPILKLDTAATVENAQLTLAATTLSNVLTNASATTLPTSDAKGLDTKGLDTKGLANLKTLSQNNSTGLLLQAFGNSDTAHASTQDQLFGDLLSLQPTVLNSDEQALIAGFENTFIQPANTDTQQIFGKFGALSSLGEANTKTILSQPADILKTAFEQNTNLNFAQPFGSLFSTALDTVNTTTKNIKEASNAASTATLASLPVSVASRALKGAREFTIHLHPAELGKVDVKMEINDKGEIKAHLRVERPETLALLQRDASALNRSLEQAGFKPSSDSLQFSLQQDTSHQRNNSHTDWTKNTNLHGNNAETDQSPQAIDVTAAVMSAYSRRNSSALDIHI